LKRFIAADWPDYPPIYPNPVQPDKNDPLLYDLKEEVPSFFYNGMPMEYFPAFESLKEFGKYEPVLNKYKLKYLEQTFNLKSLVTLKEQAYVNDDMVTHFIRWVLKNYIPDDTLFMQTSLLTSYMGSKLIPLQVLIDRVPNVASATQEFPRFSFGSVRHFYTF
jgi:hypothetical protein